MHARRRVHEQMHALMHTQMHTRTLGDKVRVKRTTRRGIFYLLWFADLGADSDYEVTYEYKLRAQDTIKSTEETTSDFEYYV